MNRRLLHILSLGGILILSSSSVFSQQFEGIINFRRTYGKDTTLYNYFVKDGNVRIEEINKTGQVVGVQLIFPKINAVRALSPERKMYIEVAQNPPIQNTGAAPEIIKGTNTKDVAGVKCTQWRVKNTEKNTEVTYWVAKGFDFFEPYLKTLNRKEKASTFFLQIDGIKGFFPLETVERTLLREEVGTFAVSKLEKKKLDNKLFMIPADYKKFEK